MFAIIAASGNGTRFGEKKQFLKIAGKYILRLIAQKLISCQIENIVIATQLEDLEKCKKILKGLEKHIFFSQGGVTRQETVKKAFLKFYENYDKTDIVLINDTMTLSQLGRVERLTLGNGVYAEVTAEIQVVDYEMEEDPEQQAVYQAKANYLKAKEEYSDKLNLIYQNASEIEKMGDTLDEYNATQRVLKS